MEKYYKIVPWVSCFRQAYNIEEIHAIAPGTQFVCKEPANWLNIMLLCDPPVLHFARGAFDSLLWYDIFENLSSEVHTDFKPPTCIYEIRPLSRVVYARSKDEHRLFQYGANKIEFVQRIPLRQIVEDAVKEYNKTTLWKRIRYKNKEIEVAKSWADFMQDKESWQNWLAHEEMIEKFYK